MDKTWAIIDTETGLVQTLVVGNETQAQVNAGAMIDYSGLPPLPPRNDRALDYAEVTGLARPLGKTRLVDGNLVVVE